MTPDILSAAPFPAFFTGDSYFIDEKIGIFKFGNAYTVYDGAARPLGSIRTHRSGWKIFLKLIIAKKYLPFALDIMDNSGSVLVTIRRGWTFWLSKVEIVDAMGNVIGILKKKFTLLRPRFFIHDAAGNKTGEIAGDWKAWNFTITDTVGNEIGSISKKWAGIGRELFTSADKYQVQIAQNVPEDNNKIIVVSTAIAIDMILKEDNS